MMLKKLAARCSMVIFLCLPASVALAKKKAVVTDHLWMVYSPIQCFGNPWEQVWLKQTKRPEREFPRAREHRLFYDYFHDLGLTIERMRSKPGPQVCNTCDCARGDLYLVYVPFNEQEAAQGFNFRKAVQADMTASDAVPSYDLHDSENSRPAAN